MKPEYTPVIMSYPDDGYSPEELNEFVKAVLAFRVETAEQYKGENIRYFFLPEGMIQEQLNQEEKQNGSN